MTQNEFENDYMLYFNTCIHLSVGICHEYVCIFFISDAALRRKEDKYMGLIVPAQNHLCERCRRYLAKTLDEPCDRCMEVLTGGWES